MTLRRVGQQFTEGTIAFGEASSCFGVRTPWLPGLLLFTATLQAAVPLDPHSQATLTLPDLSPGTPAAGKRVAVTAPEYQGTRVFHTLYLPPDWTPSAPPTPVIFEYTGNHFPPSGSTGKVEDAGLGFGLSGGRYLWVSLPYIAPNRQENEVTWWGDIGATVQYAKTNVPRIIDQFKADQQQVFLCGFSRGAIGVNFLGLRDDDIAKLWTAFIAHDHFDGVKSWPNTRWGGSLDSYRAAALERLRRIKGRPYLVSQNGSTDDTLGYLRQTLGDLSAFTFNTIHVAEILGPFPNSLAKSAHTDRWLFLPSASRKRTWQWMNQTIRSQSAR